MGKTEELPEIGLVYGRPDIERLGIFVDAGYLVGKRYSPPLQYTEVRDLKRRQMYPGVPKIKVGLQDCYFDQEFKRLFIGESYPRKRKEDKEKDLALKALITKPFYPSKYPNPLFYPGDCFGTFSGIIDEFSPKQKPKPKYVREPRGIYTSPGKKGCAGVEDITINKYPYYISTKYEERIIKGKTGPLKKLIPFRSGQPPGYFGPNPYLDDDPEPVYKKLKEVYVGKTGPIFKPSSPAKWDGGCKGGTFEAYPVYVEDLYNDPRLIDKILEQKMLKRMHGPKKKARPRQPFRPPTCCKTLNTSSIMERKIDIGINTDNWIEMKPVTYTERFVVL